MLWAAQDARRSRFWPAYHYGLWLICAGPVLIPHYVFRTRGGRGLGLAVVLSLVLWMPWIGLALGSWFYDDLPDLR